MDSKTVKLVSILNIIYGVFIIIGGVFYIWFVNSVLGSGGFSISYPFNIIIIAISLYGILLIIGGIGLFNFKNWARIFLIILSYPTLLTFPIGTALGIFSLVCLYDQKVKALFN